MAEGLLNFTRLDDPQELIVESAGRPMCSSDEIKVVDNEDREVPCGEVGELIVRGPYTIRGYYNAQEYNRQAFTPDGFYRTGDLVRVDAEGYIFTEGRKKDLINRGGEKISCEEVEEVIRRHPKIFNVAIVPMPDPVFGEKSCAYVILRQDQSLTLVELNQFLLGQQIAKFKLPERLEVIEEFPLTPVGKIIKHVLKADIKKKLEREQIGGL
jgi:2,3-dihydroxybenzoate-AMP ligase